MSETINQTTNDQVATVPAEEQLVAQEAQESAAADQDGAAQEAPEEQDGSAAKFMQRAAAAFRRGNSALLLSRIECGYWCHEYYSWRLAHGHKDRGGSSELLSAALAPYAETTRDVRPADFARWYGIASVLGAVKVSAKGKVGGIGDGLTVSKLDALSRLVIRPEETESYGHYFAPEKTEERGIAVALWTAANADGKERVSLDELTKRVTYLIDPAQGRAVELKQRLAKCKDAASYDALAKWAETVEGMMPDGRTCAAHAQEAREKAFPPAKPAPAAEEKKATSASATEEAPAVFTTVKWWKDATPEERAAVLADWKKSGMAPSEYAEAMNDFDSAAELIAEANGDEPEEEEEEEEGKDGKSNPADQRGTVTGNLLNPETAYTPKDAAELCCGILAKSEGPDDAVEALMNAISRNAEYGTKTRLLAARMAQLMGATEKTSPLEVAKQLTDTISPANGVPAALAK